jgi:hypothetical protein
MRGQFASFSAKRDCIVELPPLPTPRYGTHECRDRSTQQMILRAADSSPAPRELMSSTMRWRATLLTRVDPSAEPAELREHPVIDEAGRESVAADRLGARASLARRAQQ